MPHRLGIHAATRYPTDPRAVFVLALAVVSGLPLILGVAEPGTMQALLPKWAVILWGVALVVGSGMTLAGMSRQTIDGIITEQVGSVATGFATLIYGTGLILVGGWEATVPAAFIFGFGLSCFWRWGQLQVLLSESQVIVDQAREGGDQ